MYGKEATDCLPQICGPLWNYRGRPLHRDLHRNESSSSAFLDRSGTAFEHIATLSYISVVNAHWKHSIGTYILGR